MNKRKLFKQSKKDQVNFVELEFSDMLGKPKTIEIPSHGLEEAVEKGVWIDGSSIEGFARIMESDMYLKPDIQTYSVLPWTNGEEKTARIICDIYTPQKELFADAPRSVLKKIIEKGKRKGYFLNVGPEVEFYLFEKKYGEIQIPEFDSGSYFDLSVGDISSRVRKQIMAALKSFGIRSERAHHEVSKGQHEIGFKYGDALSTADNVITLKRVIKTKAHENGLIASFMPKPFAEKEGSGMHTHFSLFDTKGRNLFYAMHDKNNLSDLAKYFIAGILTHIKEISAVLNPTINSYKRLVKGYEAPVYICWGDINRSALIRIPRYSEGSTKSVRAELRSPDPTVSSYLAFAAIYKAGLTGIEQKIDLIPPVGDNVYDKTDKELAEINIDFLPRSLKDALEEFKQSKIMKELFGESFFEKFIHAKEKEVENYEKNIEIEYEKQVEEKYTTDEEKVKALDDWKKSQEIVTEWERKIFL